MLSNPLLISLILLVLNTNPFQDQKQYPRVRKAYSDKEISLQELLQANGIQRNKLRIYLRAFKQDQKIELWAKNESDVTFQWLKTYHICQTSGTLGPKRKQGDLQIPEGFYHINRYNPASNFYLSLGINYPNKSDVSLGNSQALGGDIFIHGACVTIGCLPITDEEIKELYIFAVEAKHYGQKTIPVTIFPTELTDKNYQQLLVTYTEDQDKIGLWADLKVGYDYFNEHKILPQVIFLDNGRHLIR